MFYMKLLAYGCYKNRRKEKRRSKSARNSESKTESEGKSFKPVVDYSDSEEEGRSPRKGTKRPLESLDTFRDPFIKRKAPVVPHGGFNNTVIPVPNYNVYGSIAAPVPNTSVYRSTGPIHHATSNVFPNLVNTHVLTTIPLVDNDEINKSIEEDKNSENNKNDTQEKTPDLKSPEIINLPDTPIKNLEDDAKTPTLPSKVPKAFSQIEVEEKAKEKPQEIVTKEIKDDLESIPIPSTNTTAEPSKKTNIDLSTTKEENEKLPTTIESLEEEKKESSDTVVPNANLTKYSNVAKTESGPKLFNTTLSTAQTYYRSHPFHLYEPPQVKPPSTKDSKEIHENKEKTIIEHEDEPKRETKVYQGYRTTDPASLVKQQYEENSKFNTSPSKNKSTDKEELLIPIEELQQRNVNEFFNSGAVVAVQDINSTTAVVQEDSSTVVEEDKFDIQDKVVDELNEQDATAMTQPKQNPIRINLRGLKPITARPVLPQYSELEQGSSFNKTDQ